MATNRVRGIFLDRDGVINRERADYVKSWDELDLLPEALDGLAKLAGLDAPIIVITNQSAIGRGIVSRNGIDAIHARLNDVIQAAGGRINAYCICPHVNEDNCSCRKPRPGLLFRAAKRFGVDLDASVFIGDAETDYFAARAAGCRSILVKTGRQGHLLEHLLQGSAGLEIVPNLRSAAERVRIF